jgi:two-component system chemotaxis response regulator CheB
MVMSSPWIVAVGASGSEGLLDIKELLAGLDDMLDAVVLVVLHRPWDQPSALREVLSRSTPLPVVVAEDDELLRTGHVYIGEPHSHLTLAENSFGRQVNDPGRAHRNRTVDLLFKSIAENARERAVGVVLAGASDDGSRGVAAIHAAGGTTMVVTPCGGGMPENAIAYDGPIDFIGEPSSIASAIRSLVEAQATSEPEVSQLG